MSAIQKWAENRSFLHAFFAPQLALTSRDLNKAFQFIKERRIFGYQYPIPPLKNWYSMYRSHRNQISFLRSIFLKLSEFDHKVIELVHTVFNAPRAANARNNNLPKHTPTNKEVEELKIILQTLLSASFKEIENDLSDTPLNPWMKIKAEQLLSEMEMESSFFLLVLAPCWLLYRTHPTRLYRHARSGDLDALDKLLRLDPIMLHDPVISKRVQSIRLKKKAAYRSLLEAPLKKPKARITRKKLKYAIAGLISGMSRLTNTPLTEPEIRSLFDAIAQDTDGTPIDIDLPDSPEAFTRAINRDRTFWLKAFNPDNKM